MNNIITSILLAWSALKSQRTRSFLTILGIGIGIAIVITIMSSGRGLDKFVLGELDVFDPDTLHIETKVPNAKKNSTENAFGQSTGITITTLKIKDLEAVQRHPNVAAAYGWVIGQGSVSYAGQDSVVTIVGEGYNMPEVEKFELSDGRIYSKEEDLGLAQVAVLGATIKDKLFGDNNAVGQTVYIKGKPFRVVGVAKKRGAAFFMDMDKIVFVPTRTMQKRLLGIDYIRAIMVKVKEPNKLKQTVVELEDLIREQHEITDPDKDDFAITTTQEARNILVSVIEGITFLLVALVCISLIVGGVGIMNIMYVSVTERTFEIGLRKAIGAKNSDILWQFLSEAVLLTLLGGIFGIALGILFAFIIYTVATANNFKWIFSIPVSSIILSMGFSGFIGLLFGIYPAKKAAALDPIEALRKE
jgi:putative ABC transport system permease protein